MSRMVIVDTETTGLNPEKHSIIELAGIMVDDKLNEISHIATYVTPRKDTEISEAAMKVNQIDLEGQDFQLLALEPAVAIGGFDSWVKENAVHDLYVAGWNPSFDVSFLVKYYTDLHLRWPFHYRVLDVQSINAFYQNFEFTNLKSVRAGQKHRALDDAYDVLGRLKELVAIRNEGESNIRYTGKSDLTLREL